MEELQLHPGGGGGGKDRISDLPDEVLLNVLSGLGSTAEAARTSALARRWRRARPLWTELHVLVFRGLDPGMVRGLLARASHRQLARLEIRVPGQAVGIAAAQVTSLLRAAEEHQPEELIFEVGGVGAGADDPFELPCFARATSVDLQIWNRSFTLPPAGEFSNLRMLTLSLCTVSPNDFLSRCPQLQVLHMGCYWVFDFVTVSSASLQELILRADVPVPVDDPNNTPQQLVIVEAPALEKFRLQSYGLRGVITSFSAPMVDTLSFTFCSKASRCIGFSWPWRWRVLSLSTAMGWVTRYGEADAVRRRVLSMVIIDNDDGRCDAVRSFAEEIVRLPVNNFSVLKLELRTNDGHAFGTDVLQLLKTLNTVQRLHLVLPPTNERGYWSKKREIKSNEGISLINLEEAEIEGLNVHDHDFDFMKLLFASAPVLKVVRVTLFPGFSQSSQRYKQLCYLLWAKTWVKCFVNGRLEAL
ncbi:hypothetical protein PAHAL_3G068200 [Panicum hallii]|uniref:Uncharacterized protein n=1 Tax=Panicum hallii TaxID=206008 RepID=A0A2S3H6Q5_9POAL|nr:hypothetical protein PAHAL_3G068200 [Panicum hallii]